MCWVEIAQVLMKIGFFSLIYWDLKSIKIWNWYHFKSTPFQFSANERLSMKAIVYDSVAVNGINCLEIDLFMEKLLQETVCLKFFIIFLHTELWIKAESRIFHRNSHLRIHATTTHDDNFCHIWWWIKDFSLKHMATIPFPFCEAICKNLFRCKWNQILPENKLFFDVSFFSLSVHIISTHNVEM